MSIRVLLVDDSTIIRSLIARALKEESSIEVVATASNGLRGVESAKAHKPDVVILDIEMPEMDGIEALPKILEVSPNSQVIMASTLTQRNASISMQALELGAADYLPKPSSTGDHDNLEIFYQELRAKVKSLGTAKQQKEQLAKASSIGKTPPPVTQLDNRPILGGFKALAIASSTGGPKALQELFIGLKDKFAHVPIFITQHMPPTFTTLLAENIAKYSGMPCAEAKDGEEVKAGHIYLAPGDFHMVANIRDGKVITTLNQKAPENFCRPAADPMLRSLSDAYKERLFAVVLTGMGQDGMLGAKEVVDKGGFVIAQDEETSVVYGMPKAVADQGLCKAILPLGEIAPYLIKTVTP